MHRGPFASQMGQEEQSARAGGYRRRLFDQLRVRRRLSSDVLGEPVEGLARRVGRGAHDVQVEHGVAGAWRAEH